VINIVVLSVKNQWQYWTFWHQNWTKSSDFQWILADFGAFWGSFLW